MLKRVNLFTGAYNNYIIYMKGRQLARLQMPQRSGCVSNVNECPRIFFLEEPVHNLLKLSGMM